MRTTGSTWPAPTRAPTRPARSCSPSSPPRAHRYPPPRPSPPPSRKPESLATLVPRYLHAACTDAGRRYEAAALQALGDDGHDVIRDPAWSAVVRRLYDGECDGWDPARLLSAVAGSRELGTAHSVAEVLTWCLDGYLADNPVPPADGRPYESVATARERLADSALTVLGPDAAKRAHSETAWAVLIEALRRADHAGYDPTVLLAGLAGERELRSARSISEVLAWRIGRHLAAHPEAGCAQAARGAAPAERLLPWLASPQTTAVTGEEIAQYLRDASDLITARVDELAAAAARQRPPWMLPLGLPPQDPETERQWLRHVAIVAAYREQFKVTTDDPRQVLGPYAEPGQSAHKAYWHAAESVLAARRLAGLDSGAPTGTPSDQARAQLAADIYRALPADQRAQVSEGMAASQAEHGGAGRAGRQSTGRAGQPSREPMAARVCSNCGRALARSAGPATSGTSQRVAPGAALSTW
jgi:hypothetical protein